MTHSLRSSWLGPLAGLVAIATIIGAAVLGPGAVRSLRIIGGVIGLVALPFALVPIFTLVRHGRPTEGKSYLHTTELVDSGLFSVVRHPQYLAYILFMLTFGLLAQHTVVTVLAILGIVLLYVSAILEERECGEKLGQEYRDYIERVPRFNLIAGVIRRLRRRD
jgi:protein-S-isoprenylcysteine O-methyltransferase Ste14